MRNLAIGIIATFVVVFILMNWIWPGFYGFMACSFNLFECDTCADFDGNCTDEITDACCIDVRHCEGVTFDDPNKCLDRYCTTSGQWCVPVLVGDTAQLNYECKCETTSLATCV